VAEVDVRAARDAYVRIITTIDAAEQVEVAVHAAIADSDALDRALRTSLARLRFDLNRETFEYLRWKVVAAKADAALQLASTVEHLEERRRPHATLAAETRARIAAEDAQAFAENANAAKSQFLSAMSHELRTPLNAIGGYAQLMAMGLRGSVSVEQQHDLACIQQSQLHLLHLVDTVLSFAKVAAGRLEFSIEDVAVAQVLAAVDALVGPQIIARGLEYSCPAAGPSDRPLIVRGDVEKMRQILVNLIANAVKFTERGGQIIVTTRATDERVEICVRDTGIGIPPERQREIFEPFVQLDRKLTRPVEGVGLGLSISRELARAMGGDIQVVSAPAIGSTFILALPRVHFRGDA
jgi:signal transduction histidine kinase